MFCCFHCPTCIQHHIDLASIKLMPIFKSTWYPYRFGIIGIYHPPLTPRTTYSEHITYHMCIYFRVRQIFAIFAYQSQSAKICTCEIFVTCNALWTFPHCCRPIALLHCFKPVNGHPPDPTCLLSAIIPPPTIRQANLDVLLVEGCDASMKTRTQGPYSRLLNQQ